MPIFEKNGERIYFAHIPKTAGSAIYVAFLRSGWRIANVRSKNKEGRIGYILSNEFGLDTIPFEGDDRPDGIAPQHAPFFNWRNWGPFTGSFAVCRNPYDRYLSALKYRYRMKFRFASEKKFRSGVRKNIFDTISNNKEIRGFFQTQSCMVGPDTEIFRFEDNWALQICDRYSLDIESIEKINVGHKSQSDLTSQEIECVQKAYAVDFEKFGYSI